MFMIREEQMEALATASEQQFVDRLVGQVRLHFAQQLAHLDKKADGEARLQEYVRQRCRQAEEYGIKFEGDYAVFVMLILANLYLRKTNAIANSGFLAWALPVLKHKASTGQVKIALIEHEVQRQARLDERAAWLHALINSVRKEFR